MNNPNVGKKIQIPLNTSTSAAPALPAADKILSQAISAAKSASFTSPASVSAPQQLSQTKNRPGRKKSLAPKTILKGIYFDPVVYKALMAKQAEGQNISKYINRLVRQDMAI